VQKKQNRKKQSVAPPDAPPYREAISDREQELDQEATPQAAVFFFFSQVDSSKTQVVVAVRIGTAARFRITLCCIILLEGLVRHVG
jgi:hypothetical protein